MDTALWITQGLLAAIFLATGTIKLSRPRAKMAAGFMTWAADVTDVQFRAIGALEVFGALGLLVPPLAPLAAFGLALTMLGAIVTHVRLGETDRLAVPAILLALALWVAVERL
jgi:uncharacterized membrane protein YphA (DoxX/SURF4 family)